MLKIRSGDVVSERWIHHEYSPIFNKGNFARKICLLFASKMLF